MFVEGELRWLMSCQASRHTAGDPLGNRDGDGKRLLDDHLLVPILNINMANGYVDNRFRSNTNS